MPVTAKLSRKFYETFGDEIANELVEWFNAVDASYQADVRELNELNCARFEAKLEQRFAESDARWTQRFAESDARWARDLRQLRAELRDLKAELIKWTFGFVAAGTLTVLGVVAALVKL